jgi:DNA mismatch endonuclease, patch repair protein
MADCYSKEVRSRVMSKIRSKNTIPEVNLRKYLWKNGIRGYRLHNKKIPGKPDIAFIGKKVAVFIDGCFWHGCPHCYIEPKSNTDYWRQKIQSNVNRDRKYQNELESRGWCVVRIWEHEIKKDIHAVFKKIQKSFL